jgi:RNA polymerase sigma-70 factor (ECF subfamily)
MQGRLHSIIMLIVHNQTVADDLLQETAAILWEKFDQFQEGTNFPAWAIRIAKNKCFEYLRENEKTKKLLNSEFYNKVAEMAEDSTHDFSNRVKALDRCCDKLDAKQQTLLRLRYSENISIKDLSVRFGQPVSTLYQHIAQVLDWLRNCITKSLSAQSIQEA